MSSRVEDAAVKPRVAQTRVALESVLEVSASSLARGVAISLDCETDLMAWFDPAPVERVLHDLVGNAVPYCNQGRTIIVAARRWNDEDSVEIAVTNSGPQIADDIRSQLLVEYVRGLGGKRGLACILSARGRSSRREDRP